MAGKVAVEATQIGRNLTVSRGHLYLLWRKGNGGEEEVVGGGGNHCI